MITEVQKAKNRKYSAAHYAKNKKHYQKIRKIYQKNNPERFRKAANKWYQQNKEKCAQKRLQEKLEKEELKKSRKPIMQLTKFTAYVEKGKVYFESPNFVFINGKVYYQIKIRKTKIVFQHEIKDQKLWQAHLRK